MDMVAGHLNYVEFACADLEFPFARDVTALARLAVSQTKGQGTRSKEAGSHSNPAGQFEALATQADGYLRLDGASMDDVRSLPLNPWS